MPNSPWTETGSSIRLVPSTTTIGSDPENVNYLSNQDKINLMAQYTAELAMKTSLDTLASTLSVSSTFYDNAVAGISSGLITAGAPSNWATIWPDGTTSGPWPGIQTSLANLWAQVATQRTALQSSISSAQAAAAYAAALAAANANTSTQVTAAIATAAANATADMNAAITTAQTLAPVVVSSLPTLPNSTYPSGKIVWNTADGQLYKSSGSAWTVLTVAGSNIVAGSITAGQIAAGAIGTQQLATTGIIVGGNGNKPGVLEVMDGSGNLVGYIGAYVVNGATQYGGWIANLQIGGSSPGSPQISTTNGNVSVGGATYTGGATIDSLKPAQAGADVTSNNTAKDTAAVNGMSSSNVASGGSFTVGGAGTSFYPVLIAANNPTYSGGVGSRSFYLDIYRDYVHENGSWYGTFHAEIGFHPSNWGNWNGSNIEYLQYKIGTSQNGNQWNDPLGDLADGTVSGGGNQLVVWLRGGATYHFTSLSPNIGWTVLNGNSGGTSVTDASGNTRAAITAQSQLVLNAKNAVYAPTYTPNINFASAAHSNKNMDNIADGSSYARVSSTYVSGGAPLVNLSSQVAAQVITGTNIANGTITTANIAANAIQAGQIAAGAITANMITTGTLNAANVAVTNLNASNITTGTLSASKVLFADGTALTTASRVSTVMASQTSTATASNASNPGTLIAGLVFNNVPTASTADTYTLFGQISGGQTAGTPGYTCNINLYVDGVFNQSCSVSYATLNGTQSNCIVMSLTGLSGGVGVTHTFQFYLSASDAGETFQTYVGSNIICQRIF